MAPSDTAACSICGRVKAHQSGRPPYCPDCKSHSLALRIGSWISQASCRDPQHDPELWWPETTDVVSKAQAIHICWSCPVRPQCLAYAIENDEREGIWGGHDAASRRPWHNARKVRSA